LANETTTEEAVTDGSTANTTASVDALETKRVTELRIAQEKAQLLFREVEARGLIGSGTSEGQLNEEIYALAKEMDGIGN
jgi:Xaa-Pro dipeptidase